MALTFTEGKSSEDINIEHQRLLSLINSMADAVISINQQMQIVQFNSSALNILDVNNINIGTDLTELFKPIDKNNQLIDVRAFILNTKIATTNRDLRLGYKDGSFVNLYISIAPVHIGYGKDRDSGYVMLIRDITREKSLEEERNEFISVVSHELRTPITIAEGNLSNALLLTRSSENIDKIKIAIDRSHDQILFLAEMINDLSTLSRAESGILHVILDDIDIKKLIDDLITNYSSEANKKKIKLLAALDPAAKTVSSSRLYVREILQNFITNALKYTDAGEVVIHTENQPGGVIISVHDSGIGISKADQEKVFDKFYRSEDYRTRKANGTGLGLYVTLKLTRLIHGKLYLQSELNKGSTFSVFVPNLK